VYGAVPPVIPTVELYGAPTVPFGSCEVVIVIVEVALEIVMVIVIVAVAEAASVTRAVPVEMPAMVGVPEMTPVLESVRPAGSEPDAIAQV
jgi:hypothetical protein